jgi:hypothetical protein
MIRTRRARFRLCIEIAFAGRGMAASLRLFPRSAGGPHRWRLERGKKLAFDSKRKGGGYNDKAGTQVPALGVPRFLQQRLANHMYLR